MEGLGGRGWPGRERGREGKVWDRRMSGHKYRQQREKGNTREGDQRTKNWGLKCLKGGREMEVCSGEKHDGKLRVKEDGVELYF